MFVKAVFSIVIINFFCAYNLAYLRCMESSKVSREKLAPSINIIRLATFTLHSATF